MASIESPGSSIDIFGNDVFLFADEAAFRELAGFGDSFPGEALLRLIEDGRAVAIDRDTPVRVIERIERGAKVSVTSGPRAGEVGWMFEGAFTEEPSDGGRYGTDA